MIKIKSLHQIDKRTNSEGRKLAIFSDSRRTVNRIVSPNASLLERLRVEVLLVNTRKNPEIAREYGAMPTATYFMPYVDGNLQHISNGDTTAKSLRRDLRIWYR